MEISDAILVTIKSAGGNIIGRTAIQKLIYFESIFGLVEANYRPHYYGPYSNDVSEGIQELTELDFLKEEIETSETTGFFVPNDWKRYRYELDSDGNEVVSFIKEENKEEYDQILKIVELCSKNVNLDVNMLSWAAKVNLILSNQVKPMSIDEIKVTAESFGWEITESQVNKAIQLLEELNLCEINNN